MYCRHCFKQIPDGSKFCPECGKNLAEVRVGFETMTCPICGGQIHEYDDFCIKCGASKYRAMTFDSKQEEPEKEEPEKIISCPNCHGHNIEYHTVTEERKIGCATGCLFSTFVAFLFFVFAIINLTLVTVPILCLFILIPILIRKKTEASTYAICRDCGYKWKI